MERSALAALWHPLFSLRTLVASCNSFQEAFSYPDVIYYEAGKEAACRFVNHSGSFRYGLKDNTTYGAGNDVAWYMYNGLSRGLRADNLLPGNNYHVGPPVHLEIARGARHMQHF